MDLKVFEIVILNVRFLRLLGHQFQNYLEEHTEKAFIYFLYICYFLVCLAVTIRLCLKTEGKGHCISGFRSCLLESTLRKTSMC